ncbi:serine protease filzig-like isoform X6 [Penaeus chinensis]|uniref:serine protease filzig-like isoform X6 n=1 Tax=Penaeus chinensis TaxID=139456 RepID=UPI001FB6C467|nr:serine protease filzig-like isoform X6 [Penaeus chinensis]
MCSVQFRYLYLKVLLVYTHIQIYISNIELIYEHGHPSSPGGIPQGHAEAISLGGDPFETKAERWPDLRVRKASNEQPRSTRSTLYGPGSFQRPPMTGTSDRKGSDNGNTKKGVKKSIGDKAGGDRQKQSPGKSESSKKRTRKRKEKRAKAKKKQQKRNNKVNKKTPKKGKSKMDSQNNNTAKHRGKKANSQKRNKEQSNKKAREPKEERGKKVKKKSLKKKTGKSNAKKPKDKIKVSNTKPKIRQVSDESCDSSTKVGAGEVVAVEGPGSRRAVECKHTIRTRKGNTLKMTCPRFSLSPGRCKDEKVVIKEIGKGKFKKKYCKGEIPGEDVSEAALRAVTFVHRRAKLKGKQCAVGFLCLFSASEISGKVSECGGKYKLQEGESMVVAPATFADKVSCKYTFKSPPGSTLALSCPSFNLNERGCGRERVIVREKKAKYKKKFCKTSNPAKEHGQTTSNSFTFTHKRKKLKDNDCERGFWCQVSVAKDKSTNDQLLTVKPTAEQSTTMKLITGQPVTVIPTTGQSLTEMPILGQPVTDKATVGQPTTDKSTSSDPVTVKITIKENLTNKPAAEQLVTEESSKQVVTVNPTIMEESTTGLRTIPPNQESPSMPNPPSATSATQSTTDTQGPTSTTEPPTSVQSTVSKGTSAQLSTPKQTLTQPPASTQTNSEPPVSTQTSVQPLTPTKVSVQPSQTSKSPQPSTQSATSTKTPTQITTSTQTSTLTTTSTQTSTLTTTSTQTSTLTTTSTQTSTLTTTSTQTSTLTTTSPQTSTQPVTSSQTSPQTSTQRETSTSTTAIAFQTRIFCETCGSGPSASGARVVGGQDVAIGEYPWMALVYVSRSSGKVSICGASLIKSRWLLSAAHCFYNVGYNLVAVFLGDHDITSNTEVPTTVGSVKSIVLHPQYDPETFDNDVALIELQADVAFTPLIAPVCLAAPEDVEDATKAVVTGWGDTSFGGDLSPVLQEVELDLISNAECRDFFQQTTLTITDNMMCAYTEGKDACQGDSGGPLVRQLADGRWVQLGVVSFGVECAKVGSPGIFTRASLYVDWIINVTASDSC